MSPVSGFGLGLLGGGEAPLPPWTDATVWGTVIGEYDFSDVSKISATGGKVSAVAVKSGIAPPIEQTTSANQPMTGVRTQNGLNVLDFSGNQRLIKSLITYSTTTKTVACVAVNDSPSTYKTYYGDWLELAAQDAKYLMISQGQYDTTIPIDNAWHITVGVFNGAASQFWLDGVMKKAGNSGTPDLRTFSVGDYMNGGYGLDGGIGHIILFDGLVADIPGMSKSLKGKWATP